VSSSRRVNLTIPKDLEDLFDWYLMYDERFKNDGPSSVAAHFFAEGIKAAYAEGLRTVEQMSADEFAPLAESQIRAYNAAD